MVGRGLVERNAQERSQAQAVGTAPGDAALAVDPLEVAHQQHAEVHARRNGGLAAFLFGGVVLPAATFDPAVEAGFGQQLVELAIKGMPRRFRQTTGHHKQGVLPLPLPATHRHRASSVPPAKTNRDYHTTARQVSSGASGGRGGRAGRRPAGILQRTASAPLRPSVGLQHNDAPQPKVGTFTLALYEEAEKRWLVRDRRGRVARSARSLSRAGAATGFDNIARCG